MGRRGGAINPTHVLTIVLMAVSTFVVRSVGYVGFRGRTVSPRLKTVLQAAPGCVLISVIAPHFVPSRPSELIALAITVVAATRLPMLPTVILGVVSSGVLRAILG